MRPLVALCADMVCLQHPETLGLPGENFAAQEWLRLFTSAQEARTFLRNDYSVNEVWVIACDDIEPINLAATLKHDRADRCVCLVAFEGTGSLKSRASAAGIDASLTRQAFIDRYTYRKHLGCDESPQPEHPQPYMNYPAKQQTGAARSSEQPVVHAPKHYGVQPCDQFKADKPKTEQTKTDQPQTSTKTETYPFASTPPSRKSAGFLMPVVSGSGGAGKSTIAALSALLAHRMGFRTLLLDFDLQFGDMPVFLGVSEPLAVDEVLSVPARIERLVSQNDLPALLAAPCHLEQSEAVVEHAPDLLEQLMTRFDVIVCNTGAAWAEQHALLLERSSKALFLVDQRPSSLRACQHALDLCARCGIATSPFSFVVNRCTKNALFTSIDVSCALHGVPVAELSEGGADVEELLGAGLPLELIASRNALCKSLEEVLYSILPQSNAGQDVRENTSSRRSRSKSKRSGKSRRRRRNAACL